MQYYGLKSILESNKKKIEVDRPLPSFKIADPSDTPYIEPAFEKVIYETEKPSIILISAVGATGKTALASQLSYETQLPILDLGKHEPVGSHTLTGLLTTSFDVAQIGNVFQGLAEGTYGVIIDGVDEGRSKVTSKAFEAFLDDIAKLSAKAKPTNFILLGRTSILEDCWEYLSEKCGDVGLVTILPFGKASATKYVDAFTLGQDSPYADQYIEARDFVLAKLQQAFSPNPGEQGNQFLAFIGYPPVLDAIVTLLKHEQNYHKLINSLKDGVNGNIEIALLLQVCKYILTRERDDKVIPNIVKPLVQDMPQELSESILNNAFRDEEQLIRLVAHVLRREIDINIMPDESMNEKYEAQLASWFREHPFLQQGKFRNAVFEALALATLMASKDGMCAELVNEYARTHKHSYHLVYMFDMVTDSRMVYLNHLHVLLRSAMEFRSVHSLVEIRLDGLVPTSQTCEIDQQHQIDIEIDLRVGETNDLAKEFNFSTTANNQCVIHLGPKVGGIFATVPCELSIGDGQGIEILAPSELNGTVIRLDAKEMALKPSQGKDGNDEIILEAFKAISSIETINTSGVSFCLAVEDTAGLTYPIIKHAEKKSRPTNDSAIIEKYFRLRRILLEFRSHSKGALAKYKDKIEHERVLKNEIGQLILRKLLEDEILTLRDNLYFLDPTILGKRTGVTWMGLRRGAFPSELVTYLEGITD